MSEISFLLLDVSHVDLILAKGSELRLVEAAVCSDQRNGRGGVSASHTLSLVDQGRWGREALGSIQHKTCGMAKDGYYNDDNLLPEKTRRMWWVQSETHSHTRLCTLTLIQLEHPIKLDGSN